MEIDAFRAYFLSHAAFVVRAIPVTARAYPDETPSSGGGNGHGSEETRDGSVGKGSATGSKRIDTEKTGQLASAAVAETEHREKGDDDDFSIWGAFYIKPNFPGRCSHVCNGGFITDPQRRRRGVARLMGHAFLRFAKELGYKASYFNLVGTCYSQQQQYSYFVASRSLHCFCDSK